MIGLQEHSRARGAYQGTMQIVLYNWPSYVIGGLACLLALFGARLAFLPSIARVLLAAGGAMAGYWLVASLVASYWVYDRSPLCRWKWITELFPSAPQHWANLHVGLDESTLALRSLFPGSHSSVVDLYDPREMTEPSIRRARRFTPSSVPAMPGLVTALPFSDGELDAIFLIFTAHEIRGPDLRLRFFHELRRTLKPGGRVLMVEHLRDRANFLAFGPGFFHFLPRGEWLRLAREVGFEVDREFRYTPFVDIFLAGAPP